MNTLKIPAETVTEAHIQAYERDGVVCIKVPSRWNLSRWCGRLQIGVVRIRVPTIGTLHGRKANFMAVNICGSEMRPSRISLQVAVEVRWRHDCSAQRDHQLYYDFLLTKQPGASNPTPWHQDRLYYPLSGNGADSLPSLWIALDPVTLDLRRHRICGRVP